MAGRQWLHGLPGSTIFAVRLLVNPLANPVITIGNIADHSPVPFLALVALLVLEPINREVNATGILAIYFAFFFLMPEAVFQRIGSLARTMAAGLCILPSDNSISSAKENESAALSVC